MHTMTTRKVKSGTIDVKALLAGDEEFLRALVRTALQEVLEAEMTEALALRRASDDTMPSATNEKRQENHVIRKATIGADAPAPRRPAAWVMPTALPRAASEVHFESARVDAGNVAPSPMPSTKRTAKSEASPVT